MSTQPTVDFVVIYTADLDASFRYFTQTLGLETKEDESGPDFRYITGAPGGIDFGLMPADAEHRAGQVDLYFKTHDLEGLRTTLLDKGVAASPIMHPPFGTIFTVPSPDGETLTMMAAE